MPKLKFRPRVARPPFSRGRLLVVLGLFITSILGGIGQVIIGSPLSVQAAAPKVVSPRANFSGLTQFPSLTVEPTIAVSTASINAGTVGIAAGSYTNNPYVVFGDSAHSYNQIKFPVGPSDIAGNYPKGVYDSAGNFNLVFLKRGGDGYFRIFYVKIAPDDTYTGPTEIGSQAGVNDALYPGIAASPDGRTLYVTAEEGSSRPGFFSSTDGGNTWGNNIVPPGISLSARGSDFPAIVVDINNNPHMTFYGILGGTSDVFAYDRTSNGTYTLNIIDFAGTSGSRAFFTSVASAPNGDLQATWTEDLSRGVNALKQISTVHWNHTTGKWGNEIQNVSQSDQGTGGNGAAVTIDPNGNIYIGYWLSSGRSGGAYVTSTNNGQSFSAPTIAIPTNYTRGGRQVAMASSGPAANGVGYIYFAEQLDDGSSTFSTYYTSMQISVPTTTGNPPPTVGCPTTNQPIGTLGIPPQGAYTYNLPFLANNYSSAGPAATGCFTTFVALQNIGNAPANVTFNYYDLSGNSIQVPANTCNNVPIPLAGECVAPNAFMLGNAGSAVVVSNQPLNVIVAEATPFGGTAYPVRAGANTTLVVPLAYNNAFGGFVTQLTVFNPTVTAANVTITFYDAAGNVQTNALQSFALPAFRANTLDQTLQTSKLPVGFNGWATISSTNGVPIVGQVLEQNPNNNFVAIANTQSQPTVPEVGTNATIYAPAIFNCAVNCYNTGASLVNPNPVSITVNLTYYNLAGTPLPVVPFTIGPNAIANIYNGAPHSTTNTPGLPDGGMPDNYIGSATISSTMGVVMVVNEKFAGGSGTYAASRSGMNVVNLPVVANGGGNGFVTGFTILNTTTQTVGGMVQYYDLNGVSAGSVQNFSIGPNGSQQYFQGSGGGSNLGAGFYGTAIITQTSGTGSNNLIVTTNAISPSFFYTYTEPNQ